jgi:hypothetical protein
LYPKTTAKINTLTRPFLRRPLSTRVTRSLLSFCSFAHLTYSLTQPRMAEHKWTGLKVRQTFFEYFEKRGHTIGMSFFTWTVLSVHCMQLRWLTTAMHNSSLVVCGSLR